MNKNEKKIAEIKNKQLDLIQMYRAGFLDGYNQTSIFNKTFENAKFKELCQKAFEDRFMSHNKDERGGLKDDRGKSRKPRTRKQRG